tara:strand:- start:237 stop:596 length:360 start_codon:yes stop_codon:yes gene_type:complete
MKKNRFISYLCNIIIYLKHIFLIKKVSDDLIPVKEAYSVTELGYIGSPTYYRVFKWFRKKWGYVSWIEQSNDRFVYKIYARNVYHRPIHTPYKYPYCETYEEAELELLKELIIIVNEIE